MPESEITVLDFSNVQEYIDINIFGKNFLSGRFSFMLIADAVRIALLEKIGGIWLDADTIILNKSAKKYFLREHNYQVSFWGYPESKNCYTCYMNSVAHSECMQLWLDYVKKQIQNTTPQTEIKWDYVLGYHMNEYSRNHPEEVKIIDCRQNAPEFLNTMPKDVNQRIAVFLNYFFIQQKHIEDIPTDMIILQNSWVSAIFKSFSKEDFLRCNCTMSNVLMGALDMKRNLKAVPIIFN